MLLRYLEKIVILQYVGSAYLKTATSISSGNSENNIS